MRKSGKNMSSQCPCESKSPFTTWTDVVRTTRRRSLLRASLADCARPGDHIVTDAGI